MISTVKTPALFSPAYNPLIFQVTSNNANIKGFDVKVYDADSNALISSSKVTPAPNYPTGIYLNLSDVLKNYVSPELNTSGAFISKVPNLYQSYKVTVTERVQSGANIIDGASTNFDNKTFTVWNAELDRVSFSNYSKDRYVVNLTTNKAQYLTNKPNISDVSETSSEYLYFLHAGTASKIKLSTYGYNGVMLNAYTYNVPTPTASDSKAFRLNVAPKVLSSVLGVNVATLGSYKVEVLNSADAAIVERKYYRMKSNKHYQQVVNIHFVNTLGALETFQFFNPRESIEVSKTTIKKHPFKLDSSGTYSDINNGVFNADEEILNVNSKANYRVITNPLTDAESIWLKELIASKQVYVELISGALVPVMIKNNNYNVLLKKYSGGKLNRLELEYSVAGGIIPTNESFYGYGGNDSSQIITLDIDTTPEQSDVIIYHDSTNGSVII